MGTIIKSTVIRMILAWIMIFSGSCFAGEVTYTFGDSEEIILARKTKSGVEYFSCSRLNFESEECQRIAVFGSEEAFIRESDLKNRKGSKILGTGTGMVVGFLVGAVVEFFRAGPTGPASSATLINFFITVMLGGVVGYNIADRLDGYDINEFQKAAILATLFESNLVEVDLELERREVVHPLSLDEFKRAVVTSARAFLRR